jgi:aminoglycoside phosphotransferase family enzyme/predicted kinase
MELSALIRALSDSAAYPDASGTVEVRQTHISVVFLTDRHAYKIKKPVSLGFVDFSTLEKRRHFCQEELRLNRRLTHDVYLAVVPIVAGAFGVRVEEGGPVVEWAVKMRRLNDEATLEHRLRHGDVTPETIEALAGKVATFHGQAERGERIAQFGRFEVVAANARENFDQSRGHVGTTVSRRVFERLQALTEEALARHRELIESRAARGVPCDTHGDLRLEHVYLAGDRPSQSDVVVLDCVEFNQRFRFADPVADMAFLVMDLRVNARRELADSFANAYFAASGDREGSALLPFYTSYRAVVRAKVEGIKLAEREVPLADRAESATKAHGYWLVALGELDQPRQKPCLVMVGGLPGTGKSTLAAELAARGGFQLIRSDLVRKELAGTAAASPEGFEQGIYSPEWTQRTYAECLRRAERLFFEGQRVIVDANFRRDAHRRQFIETAERWGVPVILVVCEAEPEVVRQRLTERRGDASDADWNIYLQAAGGWEEPGMLARRVLQVVATSGEAQVSVQAALSILQKMGLDN